MEAGQLNKFRKIQLKINYRQEINGLRALAVISVILYHSNFKLINFELFTGGYFGVDIFFVISGYLITSIIIKEIEHTNQFLFLNFFERRVRRIIPALVVVLIFSYIASYFFLSPINFKEISKSIIFSIIFSSNFYFYFSEIEYGAINSLLKPLLHTWSLSVEEQFYLIYPFFIIFVIRYFKKLLFLIFSAIILISLLYSNYLSSINYSFNFYIIHSRIWELFAGALLVFIEKKNYKILDNSLTSNIFCLIGLILILGSITLINKVPHPSFFTLMPVLGTCLLIYFCSTKNYFYNFLSNKILVNVGLISYSLYLWHFPIFSFARNMNYFNSVYEKTIFIIITFLISAGSYLIIERRFRNRSLKIKKILGILILTIIFLMLISNYTINKNGFDKRNKYLNNLSIKIDDYILDKKYYLENHYYKFLNEYRPDNFKKNEKNKLKVLIVGDSTSINLFNILNSNKNLTKKYHFNILSPKNGRGTKKYYIDCFEKFLTQNNLFCKNDNFTENIKIQYDNSDLILLSFFWKSSDLNILNKIIPIVKSNNKKIILLDMPVILEGYTDFSINEFDYFVYQNKRLPNKDELLVLEQNLFVKLNNNNAYEKYREINKEIYELHKKYNIYTLKNQNYKCDFILSKCYLFTDDNFKIYFDDVHITNEGAFFLGKQIYEKNWFKID